MKKSHAIFLSILSCIITFYSCDKFETSIVDSDSFSKMVLIDSFKNSLELDTLILGRESQFSPLYVGPIKHSIGLTYKTIDILQRTAKPYLYRNPKLGDIEITIDTTKTIGFPMSIYSFSDENEHRVNKKSYPVYIKNNSSDTLNIGFGNILPMVTELKNKNGKWETAEEQFSYYCGFGLTDIYLPPKQILITTLRQSYNYENMKFRVKYISAKDSIYSNEILNSKSYR
jgi:hypothetical protein